MPLEMCLKGVIVARHSKLPEKNVLSKFLPWVLILLAMSNIQ